MEYKFKLTKTQNAEVEQRLKDLLEICQVHQVPMFATVAIENDEAGTKYNNIAYSAEAHNLKITDDQIERHTLVANGFKVVPPRDITEIDMSEIL